MRPLCIAIIMATFALQERPADYSRIRVINIQSVQIILRIHSRLFGLRVTVIKPNECSGRLDELIRFLHSASPS